MAGEGFTFPEAALRPHDDPALVREAADFLRFIPPTVVEDGEMYASSVLTAKVVPRWVEGDTRHDFTPYVVLDGRMTQALGAKVSPINRDGDFGNLSRFYHTFAHDLEMEKTRARKKSGWFNMLVGAGPAAAQGVTSGSGEPLGILEYACMQDGGSTYEAFRRSDDAVKSFVAAKEREQGSSLSPWERAELMRNLPPEIRRIRYSGDCGREMQPKTVTWHFFMPNDVIRSLWPRVHEEPRLIDMMFRGSDVGELLQPSEHFPRRLERIRATHLLTFNLLKPFVETPELAERDHANMRAAYDTVNDQDGTVVRPFRLVKFAQPQGEIAL